MAGEFTTQDNTFIGRDTFRLLWRYVCELKLLRKIFPFYLVIMIFSTLLPSLFLLLLNSFIACSDRGACVANIPGLDFRMPATLGTIVTVMIVATVLRTLGWTLFEISGQLSARDLHDKMVRGLGHTRVTYFDENPSGKLINRLVRDYDQVRLTAVIRLGDFLNSMAELIAIASVAALAHYGVFALVGVFVCWIMYAQFHVALMLQRSGAMRAARIGNMLHRETDVIEGARTFLLYGKIPSLYRRLRNAVDKYLQAHLLHGRIEGWGFLWTGVATAIFIGSIIMLVGYRISQGYLDVIVAGVILTSLARLGPIVGWATWIMAYLLESVAYIRRVFEVIDLPDEVTSEFTPAYSAAQPQALVPLATEDLCFVNYTMSYRPDTPLILRNLSVRFPAAKHIGIVGRTGAGKSSLMQSLFRMVHVHSGDITLGGDSLLHADIETARRNFAVVPQDPYLFAGSLRSNLDRAKEFAETDLARALKEVGLTYALDERVYEGGSNFSLGERQLLCLARVLLGQKKIILMDEPTSGVDSMTDAKIQSVLSHSLRGRTVLTIAHRLHTLSTYDWVVLLENGQLHGEGTPEEMLGLIPNELQDKS